MSWWLRRLQWLCLVALIAGCSGGGCSGCAGGAIQPIHGGFSLSPDRRIPHAMQVRLTDQGLRTIDTLAPHLLAGLLGTGIAIPSVSMDVHDPVFGFTLCTIHVCESGDCHVNIALTTSPAPLQLAFSPPSSLGVHVRVIVQSAAPSHVPLTGCTFNGHAVVDTTQGGHPFVGLTSNVRLARDTHAQRIGYLRADIGALSPASGEDVEDQDFTCVGSGTYSDIICGLVNTFFRGTVAGLIRNQLSSALGPIQDALAQSAMPDPPGCPTGTAPTTADPMHCFYPDRTEVPSLLGTDGVGNLGALLSGITPGLRSMDSYVIAAGDPTSDAMASTNGMTLDVYGAVASGQHSQCVPRMTAPVLPTIPQWTNLQQNNIPGTSTETDLGVGVAEDFLNHAMWNLWDSGMFCLGVTTSASQQLSATTFTALPTLSSLRNVIFPSLHGAPAAMILRPQQPPHVTIGTGANPMTDPLMRVDFTQLAIDFYAWSEERYVRFMTVTTDLTLPVNLMVDAGGLRPTVGMPSTSHTTVSNSQLINAPPATLASLLDALLGTAIGMFAGSLPEIALPAIPLPGTPSPGNVTISIPATGGIQGLNENGSRYLGLFTNLGYMAAGGHDTIALDTVARAQLLPFDPGVYRFDDSFSLDRLPAVRLTMGVPDGGPDRVEYSYRVDNMTWSDWTRESTVDVRSPSFLSQGAHHIDVRARIEGQPTTADPDPARASFTIDTGAPTVDVERDGDALVVHAHDAVWSPGDLEVSVGFDGTAPASFSHESRVTIPADAARYTVRVRDLAGNEGSASGNVPAAIIRGGPSPDASSGCGCSTAPTRARHDRAALGALAVAAMLLVARRRSLRRARAVRWAVRAMPLVCAGFVGCDCGTHTNPQPPGCDGGGSYCASSHMCIAMPMCDCPAGTMASAMPAFDAGSCQWDTVDACACQPLPALAQGMAGSHLDMALATDGTVWMSSYSAGDAIGQRPYGDLIVGTFDRRTATVDWTHVDGVPATGTVGGDVNGWRGGVTDPGNDVGRWNSLVLDAQGHPRVSYWDTTHDQLRFALFDGTAWHTHAVDTTGHNGRYTSLVLLPSGVAAVAYRAIVPDASMPNHVQARVRYAVAHNATPASAADWTITDVLTAPTSCRAEDCTAGLSCVQTTGVCTMPGTGCTPACAADQACIAGMCQDVYGATWIEDFPQGTGLFCSLAVDPTGGVGLVFYDRDRGNLMGAAADSMGHWGMPFVIDGQNADGTDAGDRGAWASLAIARDGTWHVGYVDAYAETVLYTRVVHGARVGAPELVDDGSATAAGAFTDGQHVIGDSIDVDVDAMGVARVVYQDSTVQTLRLATRAVDRANWTLSVLDASASTGYWARLRDGNAATFWRDLQARHFGVRLQTLH